MNYDWFVKTDIFTQKIRRRWMGDFFCSNIKYSTASWS